MFSIVFCLGKIKKELNQKIRRSKTCKIISIFNYYEGIIESINNISFLIVRSLPVLSSHTSPPTTTSNEASQVALVVKESACQCRRSKRREVGKIPWRRKRQSIPVFLSGESTDRGACWGYSPQGCKESDTTEVTQHGTPPQYPKQGQSVQTSSDVPFYT